MRKRNRKPSLRQRRLEELHFLCSVVPDSIRVEGSRGCVVALFGLDRCTILSYNEPCDDIRKWEDDLTLYWAYVDELRAQLYGNAYATLEKLKR